MRRLLFVCALTALATPALAADWAKIWSGATYTRYIDVESISTADGITYAWEKDVFPKAREGGETYRVVKVANNCAERTRAMRSIIHYRPDGTVTDQATIPQSQVSWIDAAPATAGEFALNFACGHRK